MRLMALGGPGSGKTRSLTIAMILKGLAKPNRTWGMVGATADRREVIWRDFLDLIQPWGWIESLQESKKVLRTYFGCYEFVAAKAPSKAVGSPIQGRSWDGAGVDEAQNVEAAAHMDIDERGRRAGTSYCVIETATNFGNPWFEARKEKFKESPHHEIVRLNPLENVFVREDYWLRFKDSYSEYDWRRRILAEDIAPEQMVYAHFRRKDNVRPRPFGGDDITPVLTKQRYGRPFQFIGGTDWGTLTTVTTILKAYREPATGETLWWACDEIISGSHSNASDHVKRVAQKYNPTDIILVCDPGINTKDTDKSDYHLARREGFEVRPAYHEAIKVKHRVSMMNALFEDARGKRRLFVDCDSHRHEACKQLVRSLITMAYDPTGNPEGMKKDYKDPSHFPASVAYGVFPWEKLRGRTTFELVTGEETDPLLEKARRFAARRAG